MFLESPVSFWFCRRAIFAYTIYCAYLNDVWFRRKVRQIVWINFRICSRIFKQFVFSNTVFYMDSVMFVQIRNFSLPFKLSWCFILLKIYVVWFTGKICKWNYSNIFWVEIKHSLHKCCLQNYVLILLTLAFNEEGVIRCT